MLPCRYGGVVPAVTSEAAQPAIAELNSRVGPLVEQYVAALEKIKLKEGIRLVMTISATGNKFFQVPQEHTTLKERHKYAISLQGGAQNAVQTKEVHNLQILSRY